jgi:formylmethanofuran dehydrogenase subunit E
MRTTLSLLALCTVLGCAHKDGAGGHHAPPPAATTHRAALDRVAAIHGAAGPFAVAGYRMGERALAELGAQRGSFALEVVHEAPAQVQWSCIADGLQASTGTSPGKLNLKVIELSEERTTSVVRDRRTGKALKFTLTPEFLARWKDLPHEELPRAGALVMDLRDEEIFTVAPL